MDPSGAIQCVEYLGHRKDFVILGFYKNASQVLRLISIFKMTFFSNNTKTYPHFHLPYHLQDLFAAAVVFAIAAAAIAVAAAVPIVAAEDFSIL